jgi:hypothetical protein
LIEYQFILNPDSDNIEIEHPVGFADEFELSIKRDEKSHGMTYEASTDSLGFHGSDAVDFLREQKTAYGLKANVIFQAKARCEGEEDYTEIQRGKLNFGRWKESCGNICIISLPLEEDSCIVTLHSRWDQKVDMDRAVGFDGLTALPSYSALGEEVELPAVAIEVSIDANVVDEGDVTIISTVDQGEHTAFFRPLYGVVRQSSIKSANLDAATNYGFDSLVGDPYGFIISPIVLFEDDKKCLDEPFSYVIRLKGSSVIHKEGDNFDLLNSEVVLAKINGDFVDTPGDRISAVTFSMPLVGDQFQGTFDHTFSGTIELSEGDGLYAFIRHDVEDPTPVLDTFSIQYDIAFAKESSVLIEATKVCPPTNADAYLIHETISRATEALTDYCVRTKSEYYGRTDSQPFSFDADGCGALRFVTSGLKIRRAIQDKFFVSLKELMEGLQAIDNIGWGVEPDPDRLNKFLFVVESLDYFYQDTEIFRCPSIPQASIEIEEARHYSKIDVGYKKWEVEDVNGLDEFNSTREYRTSLDSVSNSLDIASSLVAGSYPIELTRQQSFANTGGSDYKYDNDTFIICVLRMMYGWQVEQTNITSAANIYSPATVYNYRISPLRNLMRWYRSISASYANSGDSSNKLFFNSGTGNFVAEGEMTSEVCKLENAVIRENQDLFTTHFENATDATPLWRNETIAFDYPLSLKDYRDLKSGPYGYVSYQCGQGDFEKGFIKELKYKLNRGIATFILRKKWQ